MTRPVRAIAVLLMLAWVAGCSAPEASQPRAAGTSADTATPATAPAETPAAPAGDAATTPGAAASPPAAGTGNASSGIPSALAPERGCKVDADCVVATTQTCCGAAPACVAKGAPEVDAAAVKAACEASGISSTCGYAPVESCACDGGQCRPASVGVPVDR